MIKPDVMVVLLHPSLRGMPDLSSVDLPTLAGDAVNVWCFQAEVILHEPKETGDLPR
jgi:hypothetical protein